MRKSYRGAPYASVPQECLDELDVLSTMGAKVDFPDPASDASWPKLSRRKRPDHDFHVALATRLQQHLSSLVPAQSEAPPTSSDNLELELTHFRGRVLV
jgi:hypothetical protein